MGELVCVEASVLGLVCKKLVFVGADACVGAIVCRGWCVRGLVCVELVCVCGDCYDFIYGSNRSDLNVFKFIFIPYAKINK